MVQWIFPVEDSGSMDISAANVRKDNICQLSTYGMPNHYYKQRDTLDMDMDMGDVS